MTTHDTIEVTLDPIDPTAGILIGFGHQKDVGKDTAARLIGFKRLAFADKLKELALAINPMMVGQPFDLMIANNGWDGAKKNPECRQFLQRLGVGVRTIVGQSAWLDPVMAQAEVGLDSGFDVAITDVRFQNEFDAIRDRGGYLIKIERPGAQKGGVTAGHVSETDLAGADWDAVVVNDGTELGFKTSLERTIALLAS